MKKYALFGEDVISVNDGDKHYISAFDLAEHYHLDSRECIFIEKYDSVTEKLCGIHHNDVIYLRPRPRGDYESWLEFVRKDNDK